MVTEGKRLKHGESFGVRNVLAPKFSVTRPEGEPRRGPLALLGFALQSTVRHFWQVLGLGLYLALVILLPAVVLVVVSWAFFFDRPALMSVVQDVAFIPLTVPLTAGFQYVLLLMVDGRRPKYGRVFRAFARRRLYWNVLVAGGVPGLASAALRVLVRSVPALQMDGLVPNSPHLALALRQLPEDVAWLLLAPLAFAQVHALAAGRPWREALAGSARFLVREPRVFITYAVTGFVLALAGSGVLALRSAARTALVEWLPYSNEELAAVLTALPAVATLVPIGVFATVLHVAFYREMLWRDREGEGN